MPGSAWGVEALRPSARACAPEEEDDDDLRGVKRLEGAEGKRKVARAQRRQADVIQFFGLIQGQGQRHVGMKTYTNRWENTSTVFVSVFYYRKRKRDPNSRERE